MEIKLKPPLKYIMITQPWGVNYVDFYQKNFDPPMIGHNGIDFSATDKTFVYAANDGKIVWAGMDGQGGISIQILNKSKGLSYFTLYYHLKEVKVKVLDEVKTGDVIGIPDNTGKFTTGPHLHFGLKETMDGATINKNNGFGGAINPYSYFEPGFDKLPVEKFYGKPRNWLAEYRTRFAPITQYDQWSMAGRYVQKELKKRGWFPPMLGGKEINAIVYGAWDFDAIMNPLMEVKWSYLTKEEFLRGDWSPQQNH